MDSVVGSLSATLFLETTDKNGSVFRPYLKGEVRDQLNYHNTVNNEVFGNSYIYKFTQADATGVGELGFDYAMGNITFNAAVYGEGASDRSAFGGRIGAKFRQ
jgi:hypothetical protein